MHTLFITKSGVTVEFVDGRRRRALFSFDIDKISTAVRIVNCLNGGQVGGTFFVDDENVIYQSEKEVLDESI